MPIQKPEAVFENEQLAQLLIKHLVEAWGALEFKQCRRTAWLLAATCPYKSETVFKNEIAQQSLC